MAQLIEKTPIIFGCLIKRVEIIRARVDFLEDSKVDLSDVETEAEIKAKLLASLM